MEKFLLLAEAMGETGKGLVQSTLGADLVGDPIVDVARRSGRPVTWTALLAGTWGPGGSSKVLEETAGYQANGYEIRPQVSCRPLCFEIDLNAPFLFEGFDFFAAANLADREGKKQIYQNLEFREKLKNQRGYGAAWDQTTISYLPSDPGLEEKSLQEVAQQRNCHPVEVMLDLSVENNLKARFRMAVANTDEIELEELLQSPVVVLGLSDAGAHASQLCDAGFSTHLLGYWVREKNVLTIENAIRMLTSQVADLLSIPNRGRLANGMAADIVVFDPATVGCSALRRVNDLPAGQDRLVADSLGISSVIVNGVEIRRSGENCVSPEQTLPGQLIRTANRR